MTKQIETAIDMVRDIRNHVETILRELSERDAEIERLKAALKPVLECDEYVPCGDCDVENTSGALDAVREAKRIYNEGGAK